MSDYPEHAKLRAVREQSQVCGEFLEWLQEQGWNLQHVDGRAGCPRTTSLLAQFFEIDEAKLQAEKDQMLEVMRG